MAGSEDLKLLKSIDHPCGHFDKALNEIKLRDDVIKKLLHAVNEERVIVQKLSDAISKRNTGLIAVLEQRFDKATADLESALKEAKSITEPVFYECENEA